MAACNAVGVKQHPARFPAKLPEFFVKFLTAPNDVVLDIFAGSNTTGQVAEQHGRRWLAFDNDADYVAASAFRFTETSDIEKTRQIFDAIKNGDSGIDLRKNVLPFVEA